MPIDRYFFITTAPALGELGSDPQIGLANLTEYLSESPRWSKLIGALVLFDDLLQREAFLAGELKEVEPAVLTVQQAEGEAPLPEYLVPHGAADESTKIETDRLWEAYFHHAAKIGRSMKNRFMKKWVGFEVALRNALVKERAKRLELDEKNYLVAKDLADKDLDLSAIVDEWKAAATPLEGQLAVIRARWAWAEENEAWFSFSEDEILAFAVRIMILEQYRRSADTDETGAAK